MTMLAVQGLRSGYGKIEVLHDVGLTIEQGQIVTLIGANGAGKTTLLKTISGLIRPTAGTIEFEGQGIARRPAHKIVALGISQVPEGRAVLRRMTVMDNLRMGAFVRRDAEIARYIDAVLVRFPALAERRQQLAGTLSGGEQQMLAIGRALVAQPRLLLMDEPSLGLAPKFVTRIFQTLRELKRELTILLIEHDMEAVFALADRITVLVYGRIIASGTPEAIRANADVRQAYLGEQEEAQGKSVERGAANG